MQLRSCDAQIELRPEKFGITPKNFNFFSIDLMHKSSCGPCILGNENLRFVMGYSSRRVSNNNA